jgi:hypothetical protein
VDAAHVLARRVPLVQVRGPGVGGAVSLSRRAYAEHRRARGLSGVSDRAVRKAIATGRIALEADGGIDAAAADRQWAASTAPRATLQTGRRLAVTASAIRAGQAPDPDKITWAPTKALRRRWRLWLEQLEALDDAVMAEVERTHDDGFCPPTGIARLDAYSDFMSLIAEARHALEQAADPALVRYRRLDHGAEEA